MLLKNGGNPRHWSSDSKWLFHSNWENNHLYSLDNNKNFHLPFPEQVGKLVSFSPVGEKMLFYRSSYDAIWPIKIVSTLGGVSFKPFGNEEAYGSKWMGNSKQILVQGEDDQGNIAMKIVPLAGGNSKEIKIKAEVDGEIFPFDFVPGFTHVAFSVRSDDGRKDLYIAPFSMQEARITGPARMIFEGWSGGAHNVTTSWSHDGNQLALSHDGDIWVIPLNGGSPIQLTETPAEERWIDWSPDGKWISYKIFNQAEKSETLHVIQSETGNSRKILDGCERESIWNMDSESILLFTDYELEVVSLDGKILEHILSFEDLGIEMPNSPCLSPDGKHFAFVGYKSGEGGEETYIIMYSFDNKKITRLGQDNLMDYKYSLDWSPDGKWLSYLTYEEIKVRPEGSLWEADFEEVKQKLLSRE